MRPALLPETIERTVYAGDVGSAPVFIVGAPRSSTTLLRNMLNRHSAMAICRETGFYHYVYLRRRSFGDLASARKRERLIDAFLSSERVRRTRMNLKLLRSHLLSEGCNYRDFYSSFLLFNAHAHEKQRWGEKTPHPLFIETLCDWYPRARVLHLLRDPRDVVRSLLGVPWAPDGVLANARWWLRDNLNAFRSHSRPRYLQVRYEDLATRPEQELRRICAFLHEEYEPAMLMPRHDPTADRPWFQRAEQPVTVERVEKWRGELRPEDVGLIEWVVGPHLQAFGYQPVAPPPSRVLRLRAAAAEALDAVRQHAGEFSGWLVLPAAFDQTGCGGSRQRQVSIPRLTGDHWFLMKSIVLVHDSCDS